MDIDNLLVNAIRDGIREGIKTKLGSSYGNPLDGLIKDALAKYDADFRSMLYGAVQSAVGEESFREEIAVAVRHKLAQVLIARFGGELEKQVNILKSDPTTRARITLAIEEIVKERCSTV